MQDVQDTVIATVTKCFKSSLASKVDCGDIEDLKAYSDERFIDLQNQLQRMHCELVETRAEVKAARDRAIRAEATMEQLQHQISGQAKCMEEKADRCALERLRRSFRSQGQALHESVQMCSCKLGELGDRVRLQNM